MDASREPGTRLRAGALLVGALGAASIVCVATVELRTRQTHDPSYRFLDWNLFLAWLPLLFAFVAWEASRRRVLPVTVGCGVLWLLFFPNAPYMLTDFIHLQESPSAPLWYDGLMLSSFAWTALLIGFSSLYLMQTIWQARLGTAWAWGGVVAVLALACLGISIGRFVGYNSWDALIHPRVIAHVLNTQVENPIHHPRLAASLLALTVGLTIAYAVFYGTTKLHRFVRGSGSSPR